MNPNEIALALARNGYSQENIRQILAQENYLYIFKLIANNHQYLIRIFSHDIITKHALSPADVDGVHILGIYTHVIGNLKALGYVDYQIMMLFYNAKSHELLNSTMLYTERLRSFGLSLDEIFSIVNDISGANKLGIVNHNIHILVTKLEVKDIVAIARSGDGYESIGYIAANMQFLDFSHSGIREIISACYSRGTRVKLHNLKMQHIQKMQRYDRIGIQNISIVLPEPMLPRTEPQLYNSIDLTQSQEDKILANLDGKRTLDILKTHKIFFLRFGFSIDQLCNLACLQNGANVLNGVYRYAKDLLQFSTDQIFEIINNEEGCKAMETLVDKIKKPSITRFSTQEIVYLMNSDIKYITLELIDKHTPLFNQFNLSNNDIIDLMTRKGSVPNRLHRFEIFNHFFVKLNTPKPEIIQLLTNCHSEHKLKKYIRQNLNISEGGNVNNATPEGVSDTQTKRLREGEAVSNADFSIPKRRALNETTVSEDSIGYDNSHGTIHHASYVSMSSTTSTTTKPTTSSTTANSTTSSTSASSPSNQVALLRELDNTLLDLPFNIFTGESFVSNNQENVDISKEHTIQSDNISLYGSAPTQTLFQQRQQQTLASSQSQRQQSQVSQHIQLSQPSTQSSSNLFSSQHNPSMVMTVLTESNTFKTYPFDDFSILRR